MKEKKKHSEVGLKLKDDPDKEEIRKGNKKIKFTAVTKEELEKRRIPVYEQIL